MADVRISIGWPQRVALGMAVGILGGALTFAHYRQTLYPAALPTPAWLPLLASVLLAVGVAALHLSLDSAIAVVLISTVVSMPAYLSFVLAPSLVRGVSPQVLALYITYGVGGQGYAGWLVFFPMIYVGAYGGCLVVDEYLLG